MCSSFGECGVATLLIDVDVAEEPVIEREFFADGEIRVGSRTGRQSIPWLTVTSGELTPPNGSTFDVSSDDPSFFSVEPAITGRGALTFTPEPGTQGTTVIRIIADDPVNGRRVFSIRLTLS